MEGQKPSITGLLLTLLFVAACSGAGEDDGQNPTNQRDGGSQVKDGGSNVFADGSTHTEDGGQIEMDGGGQPPRDGGQTHAGPLRMVGYYPAWATYTRDFQVSELPGSSLTHINYAFANIQNGQCVVGDPWADTQKTFPGDTWDQSSANRAGNFNQLRKLRDANPSLRTLISIGGWTWSTHFSTVAASAQSRATFVESCVDFAVTHGFDGIDIDWEYPVGGGLPGNVYSPADKHNYTLLLQAFRAELDARRTELSRSEAFLLTIAAPAGPSIIPNLEAAAIADTIDWINVMTYDFHGSWDTSTGFNAPLRQSSLDTMVGWNVEAAIEAYIDAGVPPAQLVMGVPFYGRSWQGVSAGTTNGLARPATGAGPGTWENGVLDYHDIVARYMGAGYTLHRDPVARVPWLFNASTGVFITYDDPESLGVKRDLAVSLGLGGMMIWDMSSDTASHTLMQSLR